MGSDLELCVHAHEHDVDLTIKASIKLNYSLGISSSYIWDLAFCNRGSDHVLLKIPFLVQVKALAFCRVIPSPTSILICRRVLPPGISRLSQNCITSYEFFIKYYILTGSNFSRAPSFFSKHSKTPITESSPHCD